MIKRLPKIHITPGMTGRRFVLPTLQEFQHNAVQEPFKKILNIPAVLNLHSLIPIGYPPQKLSGIYRRKLGDVLHYETYDHHRLMSDPEIAEYYFEHRNKTVKTYIQSHGEAAPNVDEIWQKIGKPGLKNSASKS